MIKQIIETRKSRIVDEGTMGFHDYIEKFEMSFDDFIEYITEKYNRDDIEVMNISYPSTTKAVIVYRDKLRTIEEWEKIYDTFVMDTDGFPKNTNRIKTLFSKTEFIENCKKSTIKFSEKLFNDMNNL